MRWRAFLLALATAGPSCLPPEMTLGSSDGAAGRGGTSLDGSPTADTGTGDTDGSIATGGAAGRAGSGAAGNDASAGRGGAAGSGGNSRDGGGGDRDASAGGMAGVGGSSGAGGSAGVGGAAGLGGVAGLGGIAGSAGRPDGSIGGGAGIDTGALDVGNEPRVPSCRDKYPNAIFCDDFESPQLNWNAYPLRDGGMDGETRRTTTGAHRGSGALYSRKDGLGDGSPVYVDVLGGRTSGRLFVRTFLYVRQPLPGDIEVGQAASILVLGESGGSLGGTSFVLWRDAVSLTIRGKSNDNVVKPMYPIPNNQWLCLQLDLPIGPATVPRIRINGQDIGGVVCPVMDAGVCNTEMETSYERLWLGINWTGYTPSMPAEVLYDDIVVSTSEVPCTDPDL